MWEYKIENLGKFKGLYGVIREEELNKIGKNGWELVTIRGESAIFKRKVKNSN